MTSILGTAAFPTDTTDVARQPLEAEQCALIVVDIQEKLLPPIFNKGELVKNSQLLVRLANTIGIPLVVTTQYAQGLGAIVPEIASLVKDIRPIDKLEFGCFGSNVFRSALKSLPGNRNTVLLCGMEAHICVMQTALGALNQGLTVHVAADAVSSRTELNWKLGLERMKEAGAVISSAEMMIYELLSKSGSAEFREMLQYLK